jgi:putative ABC transport system substrate-binding protein
VSGLLGKEVESAAETLGLSVIWVAIRDERDYEGALDRFVDEGAQALIVVSNPILNRYSGEIAERAVERGLPIMSQSAEWAQAGALMSYSPDLGHLAKRAGYYVAKILAGENPAELPVEQPTRFELIINLRTAQALGLRVPASLILRATEVIE